MADFKPFSLSEAVGAGQKMAANQLTLQGEMAKQKKATKAAGLRQRVSEGDEEALSELMAIDPKEATQVMTFLNTAEDRDRENMKAQNEAVAKGITWVMQAPTEQERAQRWDQTVDHMEKNQGQDVGKYRGKYSQGLAQTMLMQAMTMDQLLAKGKGSFGQAKAGLDKDGNPVFFSTDASGKKVIHEDIRPTDKELYGKGKGGKGGREIKASDSNAIANAAGNELNVPFTKMPDGSIKFQFATDEQAKQVTEITARAEELFSEDKSLGHRGALLKARQEVEPTKEKTPSEKNTSAKEWLKNLKPNG